jgi:hypothetical protein
MHSKVGAMTMLKFTPLAILACMASMSAFNPSAKGMVNIDLLKGICKLDSSGPGYYMGADLPACSLLYFMLMYYKMFRIAIPMAIFDTLYYGPMYIGAPAAGILGAMALL